MQGGEDQFLAGSVQLAPTSWWLLPRPPLKGGQGKVTPVVQTRTRTVLHQKDPINSMQEDQPTKKGLQMVGSEASLGIHWYSSALLSLHPDTTRP